MQIKSLKRVGGWVAALALAAVIPAFAETAHETLPITMVILDPCSAEVVKVAGEIQYTMTTTLVAGGHLEIDLRGAVHATGSGMTTGAAYVWNENWHFAFESTSPTFDITQTMDSRLVGQGSVKNLKVRTIISISPAVLDVKLDKVTCQ